MASRNELYRKTMDLLDNDLDGNEDPALEDIVQRYFQKRNSRVSKSEKRAKRLIYEIIYTHALPCYTYANRIDSQGNLFPGGYVGRTSGITIDDNACSDETPVCNTVNDFTKLAAYHFHITRLQKLSITLFQIIIVLLDQYIPDNRWKM